MCIQLNRGDGNMAKDATPPRKGERWKRENKAALDSSNAHVELHGLPLRPFRLF